MFDCLALWIEHARLQCDVDFGFHSINISPAHLRPAGLYLESRNAERGILRQNIAFVVVNIIVSPPVALNHLYKRKFRKWHHPIQKVDRRQALRAARRAWVSTQISERCSV